MKHIFLTILIAFVAFGALPASALASEFNPGNVISNGDFFDSTDMTESQIQDFLARKGSTLSYMQFTDKDGNTKKPSKIIWEAAQEFGVNPKVLLVLLQKEQSLIEGRSPSQRDYDWATGYAVCDSCTTGDSRIQRFRGFAQQIRSAAAQKVYYTTHPHEFTYRVGSPVMIDGQLVIPENAATAALYNYTPHLHGNFNFWKLWLRYFGTFYPDGTVVREDGSDEIYLLQDGMKRRFSSMTALLSRYSMSRIVVVGEGDLDNYEEGEPIRFPQYSLVQAPNGAVFLLVDDKKYGITSREVFRQIGFNPEEVEVITQQEVDDIPLGGFISEATESPMGELLQDTSTGGVYFVKQKVKHPIWAREILTSVFPYLDVKAASPDKLASYPTGSPVLLEDGTLVTSPASRAVYVISNGERRRITSQEVFTSLGYDWSTILNTSDRVLTLHPEGEPIEMGRYIDEPSPYYTAVVNDGPAR